MNIFNSRLLALVIAPAATAALFSMASSPANAQWPTSYLAPKALSSGVNVRAGSVLAMSDGGVMVCYDAEADGIRRLKVPRYDATGNLTIDQAPYTNNAKCAKAFLLSPPPSSELSAHLTIQYTNTHIAHNTLSYLLQSLYTDGTWANATFTNLWNLEYAVRVPDGSTHQFYFLPRTREIGARKSFVTQPDPLSIGIYAMARNFHAIAVNNSSSLAAFEKYTEQPGTASEIWTYYMNSSGDVISNLVRSAVQNGEAQTKAQLTNIFPNQHMLTWLGSLGNNHRLYGKVVSNQGNEVSPPRLIMSNVVDYKCSTSTLGIPVVAGVQRNTGVYPPVDTLFGGLIDATNGLAVTLPLVNGLGIKVKTLQQEPNGDFSLFYSIPENGTTLLKCRRISTATAGTLWETTIANLGMASEAIVDGNPNTFVAGNSAGVNYILTRYDQPYTNNSTYHLARLRPDGQLGGD